LWCLQLSEGDLASFSFEQHEVDDSQTPHLTGLAFVKRCSPQRALPDSWTKILFQYNARSGGVPIEQIFEVRACDRVRYSANCSLWVLLLWFRQAGRSSAGRGGRDARIVWG
jgi:hypothetical protein